MISCKLCVRKVYKTKYSIELQYADSENPIHSPIFWASDSVKISAARLTQNSLLGINDNIMRMYDCESDCFVDGFLFSKTPQIVYTGAPRLTENQLLDCINRLLVGIHTVSIDATLLIEMNDTIIESWHSTSEQKNICTAESQQKEANLINALKMF